MSILGKDFEDTMKRLSELIQDAQLVVLNINNTVIRINLIMDKIFGTQGPKMLDK